MNLFHVALQQVHKNELLEYFLLLTVNLQGQEYLKQSKPFLGVFNRILNDLECSLPGYLTNP